MGCDTVGCRLWGDFGVIRAAPLCTHHRLPYNPLPIYCTATRHFHPLLLTHRFCVRPSSQLKEKPLHWTGDEQRAVLDLALSIDMSQDDMLGLDAQAEEEGRVKDWAK